ncbi:MULTISPECIES: hypothetical protein [Intestinibacter]|uniref:hypothetical protein n=1 Tax=Intestinibacter TaxID=1505657 RepID=UPI00319E8EA4
MKDYKDIDDVLKQSLSSKESPSIGLNVELRIKMENQIEENKGISIWWLPMTISTCISAMAYILVKLFIDYGYMQNILIGLCIITAIFNIIMTIIGTKYFELKKGARINI